MDAQSVDIGPKRRARMDQMRFNGEIQQLRSDMLEVEDRIVEDLDRLKELLTPSRVANYLFLTFGQELLEQIKAADWGKLEEVSDKAKQSISNHKVLSALLGIGASGLLIYALRQSGKNDRPQYSPKKFEVNGSIQ